jgi:hypothetical protein
MFRRTPCLGNPLFRDTQGKGQLACCPLRGKLVVKGYRPGFQLRQTLVKADALDTEQVIEHDIGNQPTLNPRSRPVSRPAPPLKAFRQVFGHFDQVCLNHESPCVEVAQGKRGIGISLLFKTA